MACFPWCTFKRVMSFLYSLCWAGSIIFSLLLESGKLHDWEIYVISFLAAASIFGLPVLFILALFKNPNAKPAPPTPREAARTTATEAERPWASTHIEKPLEAERPMASSIIPCCPWCTFNRVMSFAYSICWAGSIIFSLLLQSGEPDDSDIYIFGFFAAAFIFGSLILFFVALFHNPDPQPAAPAPKEAVVTATEAKIPRASKRNKKLPEEERPIAPCMDKE